MSMTSLLYKKDVWHRFKREFNQPKLDIKKEPLAPALTEHDSLVATAFDYLMRFYLEASQPTAVSQGWIAEASLKIIRELRSLVSSLEADRFDNTLFEKLKRSYHYKVMPQTKHILKYAFRKGIASTREEAIDLFDRLEKQAAFIINKAKQNYFLFLKTGNLTDDLVRSSLFLGQLDTLYRIGRIDINTGVADGRDIQDLKNLIDLVDFEKFRSDGLVLLNPTFGVGSSLVGGADADLVVDDAIIEIKTARKLALQRAYVHKLVFQYTLHRIAEINGAPPSHKINRLGIYFSRYGYLHMMNVGDLIEEKKFLEFRRWFEQRAKAEKK